MMDNNLGPVLLGAVIANADSGEALPCLAFVLNSGALLFFAVFITLWH